jgi:hypothetical protein
MIAETRGRRDHACDIDETGCNSGIPYTKVERVNTAVCTLQRTRGR